MNKQFKKNKKQKQFNNEKELEQYRFDNPFLPAPSILPGLLQQFHVLREHKGTREEAKLPLAKPCLHLGEVPPQTVFPSDLKGTWKMIQLQNRNKIFVKYK